MFWCIWFFVLGFFLRQNGWFAACSLFLVSRSISERGRLPKSANPRAEQERLLHPFSVCIQSFVCLFLRRLILGVCSIFCLLLFYSYNQQFCCSLLWCWCVLVCVSVCFSAETPFSAALYHHKPYDFLPESVLLCERVHSPAQHPCRGQPWVCVCVCACSCAPPLCIIAAFQRVQKCKRSMFVCEH